MRTRASGSAPESRTRASPEALAEYTSRRVALLTVSLLGLAIATPRSRLLTLDLDGHAFHFQAGQAVMMGPHGSSNRRPFSIANAPDGAATARRLELLIAADIGTDLSWASPGALVDIDGPIGTFTYDNAPAQP